MKSISILGSGSWGSAIGAMLSKSLETIKIWQRDEKKANEVQGTRKHPFLSDYYFSENIVFTSDLHYAVDGCNLLTIAIPSHAVREVLKSAKQFIQNDTLILNLSKGLEEDTFLTMSQVIQDELSSNNVQVVSVYGPSHAEEVIKNIPTSLVAASDDIQSAKIIQGVLSSQNMRVYTNKDVIGVELGGSIKNIIAIAAGISDGIGYGDNTKAAIVTRGIAEMRRLGLAMGAKESTISGLRGIGDLFVTCSSKYSRNRYFGEMIGKGHSREEILKNMDMVAEGVRTTKVVHQLCQKHNIVMPISSAIYHVIYNKKDPRDAVSELMSRDLTAE